MILSALDDKDKRNLMDLVPILFNQHENKWPCRNDIVETKNTMVIREVM